MRLNVCLNPEAKFSISYKKNAAKGGIVEELYAIPAWAFFFGRGYT